MGRTQEVTAHRRDPGRDPIRLEHLVLDINGTLTTAAS